MTDQLIHHYIDNNGCRIHVVDAGEGPVVVLCHGFPELWLSWRHQIPALVAAGFRVLAPDMRGHGESGVPLPVEEYSVLHTVGDVMAVLDALGIDRAIIVGHDAGTTCAYHAALMRPDRIRGVVGLSVPYVPRGEMSLIAAMRQAVPESFYMLFFQTPGMAEADLEQDPHETLRRIIFANSGNYTQGPIMMMAQDGSLVKSLPAPDGPIDFLPEAELNAYAASYRKTGFAGALNGYRVFDLNWQLTAPWTGMKLPVPSTYIGGTMDTVLQFPGFRQAAEQMGAPTFIEGAGHWVQAERPDAVNRHLVDFCTRCPQ